MFFTYHSGHSFTGRNTGNFGLIGLAFAVCLFLTAFLSPGAAHAAKNSQAASTASKTETVLPRWWTMAESSQEGQAGLLVSGDAPLNMWFVPDEALCRERFGNDWYPMCMRRTGMAGRPVFGKDGAKPVLSPSMPGQWRWEADFGMTFTPEKAWPAGTRYTVTLPVGALPQGTSLKGSLGFASAPLKADQLDATFQFDPQDTATMAISGSATFNYPVDRESVIARFTLGAQSTAGDKALLGKTEWEWTDNGSQLYFSAPVLSLPDKASSVRVALGAGFKATSGGPGGHAAEMVVPLQGKNDLFTMQGAEVTVLSMANLQAKQALTLQFSLPVKPASAHAVVKALLLPRQRVAGTDSRPPYAWWSKAELTSEVLAQAQPVNLTVFEGANVPSTLTCLTFNHEVEAGRSLLVTLPAGLKSEAGFSLSKDLSVLVQVPALSQDLRIMQNGAVLPLFGSKTLSIYSRNLDSIQYEAAQVLPEYINHLATQREAFSSPGLYGLNLYQLSTITRGNIPLALRDAESPQFSSLDLGPVLQDGRKGLFMISLTGRRGTSVLGQDQRFVLVTDIGLIRKLEADGASRVFAVSIATGKPLKGVDVRVLGANGLPVFQVSTDAKGMARLPALEALRHEKRPVALTAALDNDLAFLPLNDQAREINYSAFEVGGNRSAWNSKGLNGWLFGQRDMYRPGESVHVGYIVKQGVWDASLKGLPLRARVFDPRGNVFDSHDFRLDGDGFGELQYSLPETALTGSYSLDLLLLADESATAGSRSGATGSQTVLASTSFMVEEFQPDDMRLTLRLEPSASKGWLRVSPQSSSGEQGVKDEQGGQSVALQEPPQESLRASVDLANLFGTPAVGRRIRASMASSPAFFTFREYPGWNFYDAAPALRYGSEALPETTTDEEGHARLALPPTFYQHASMRLNVWAEGFDAGGGHAVRAEASVLVSPLPWVLGWKSGSDLDYLPQLGKAELDMLALAPDLTPVDTGPLSIETVAVSWVKSLIRTDQGQYLYDMLRQEKVESKRPWALSAKGEKLSLDLSRPGEWLLVIRNAEGAVVARIPYVVAGTAAARFGEDRNPQLGIRLNKADYNPGEEIEMFLSLPYKGTGLITVERDKVESFAWFNAKAGSLVQRLRLPEDFEGKAYVNVTYFRATDDQDIFTKALATAVAPFTINMETRDLNFTVQPLPSSPSKQDSGTTERGQGFLPSASGNAGEFVARPGSFRVKVTADSPCRAVLFAVDEGILQMTSYATPDPLDALLGDRALQVRTSQYFDLLMPEYALMQKVVSAFGGGDDMYFAAAGQNPFRRSGEKSAVFWSGIMTLGPEGHIVDIPTPPSFSGRMRVMVVGASPDEVGSARTDVLVRPEVVIQPSLPLFVAPGDIVEVPVTLTDTSALPSATGAGRTMILDVETEGGLALEGSDTLGTSRRVTLKAEKEEQLVLRVRALDQPGEATLTLVLSPLPGEPGQEVRRPLSLSVRPATPRVTQAQVGSVMQKSHFGFMVDVPFTRQLYPQYASLSASVSTLPLPVAHGLFRYLSNTPYDCTEQVVSAAFPALFLLRYPQFAPHGEAFSPDALRQKVMAAMGVLQARHTGDGAFAMWPGGYAGDFFLSVYIADFLTTAEENGVSIGLGLKSTVLRYVQNMASAMPGTMDDARIHAYAAWVLTRNGILSSNILATLTAWLDAGQKTGQPDWHQDISAVFMAACWELMMEKSEAKRLLDGYKAQAPLHAGVWPSANGWLDPLTSRSLYLSVLAGQFPERLASPEAHIVLEQVLELAQNNDYVTLSAAQAARAVMLYSKAQTAAVAEASILALDKQGKELGMAQPQADVVRELALQTGADGLTLSPRGADALLGLEPEPAPNTLPETASESAIDPAVDILPRLASLRFSGSGPFYWQVESTGFDRHGPTAPVMEGMEISREYRTTDGNIAKNIRLGDELLVFVRARAYGGSLDNVAITDMLPGCFEVIVAESGSALGTRSALPGNLDLSPMLMDYVERREDRLLLFASLNEAESVYAYRVRVSSRGSFMVPPVSAEAMYRPTLRASSAAGTLVIE